MASSALFPWARDVSPPVKTQQQDDSSYPSRLDGYLLGRILGSGGFALVYKATVVDGSSPCNGMTVAIKVIDKAKMRRDKMTARVANEVSVHWVLDHPCVLRLHNFFEDSTNVYLVMEYCPGGELQERVSSLEVPMPEDEIQPIFAQIVLGLIYLHSHGILHRDLKLSNILLGSGGVTKIADFGLSVALNNKDSTQDTICGTPNYISPELLDYRPYGLPSDMWSLGCILVTLLTGVTPFDGVQSMKAYTSTNRPYTLPSNSSSQARRVVNALLAPEPHLRATAYDLLSYDFVKSGVAKLDKSILNYLPDACFKILIQQERPITATSSVRELPTEQSLFTPSNKQVMRLIGDTPPSAYRTPLQSIGNVEQVRNTSTPHNSVDPNSRMDLSVYNKENISPLVNFGMQVKKLIKATSNEEQDLPDYRDQPLRSRWEQEVQRTYSASPSIKHISQVRQISRENSLVTGQSGENCIVAGSRITTAPLSAFQKKTKYGVVTLHEDRGWISFYFKDDSMILMFSPFGTIVKVYTSILRLGQQSPYQNSLNMSNDSLANSVGANSSGFKSLSGGKVDGTPISGTDTETVPPASASLFSRWIRATQKHLGTYSPTTLPSEYRSRYRYAEKFVNILLSKKPYMKFSNNLLEVSLMCDTPTTVEFKFVNGLIGTYNRDLATLIINTQECDVSIPIDGTTPETNFKITGRQLEDAISGYHDGNSVLPEHLRPYVKHVLQMAKICYEYESDRNSSIFLEVSSEPEEDNFPTKYVDNVANILDKSPFSATTPSGTLPAFELSPVVKPEKSYESIKEAEDMDIVELHSTPNDKGDVANTAVNTPLGVVSLDALQEQREEKTHGETNARRESRFIRGIGWCVEHGDNCVVYFDDGVEMEVLTRDEKVVLHYYKLQEDNLEEGDGVKKVLRRDYSEVYDLIPPIPEDVRARLAVVPRFFGLPSSS